MKLHELAPVEGSTRKRNRIGRGIGSGNGKTAGRGQKGQLSRSGASVPARFEGGQMPLHRRLPKRGFHNAFGREIDVVNVGSLGAFAAGSSVDLDSLKQGGLVRGGAVAAKILGSGEISVALSVVGLTCSASARAKIEAAGGSVSAN